jgi:hypothetical protein
MAIRDISEICEIASRLSEEASTLRSLGLNEAARYLDLAEGELDNRVYTKMSNGGRGRGRELHSN